MDGNTVVVVFMLLSAAHYLDYAAVLRLRVQRTDGLTHVWMCGRGEDERLTVPKSAMTLQN